MPVYVDNAAGMVRTSYGTATINNFKNVLYINADEAEAIFNINGGKYSSNSMVYTTNPPKKTAEVTNSDTGTKVNETAVFNRNIDPVYYISAFLCLYAEAYRWGYRFEKEIFYFRWKFSLV